MNSRRSITERILTCALAVMLAVAFLLPPKAPSLQDSIRAAYAAQGLLCAPAGTGDADTEAHCVLCLVPALHAPCDTGSILTRRVAVSVEAAPYSAPLVPRYATGAWHARAPPVRRV